MAVQMPTAVLVSMSAKFFLRYWGSSVMRRWKPQLLPTLETMMAQKGREVQMARQGMGGEEAAVAGRPAEMYSSSSFVMVGWVWGVSATSHTQRASQMKQAPASGGSCYVYILNN